MRTNKKRNHDVYSGQASIKVAEDLLGRKIEPFKRQKCYPASYPTHPKQYRDVEDEFDHRFTVATAKRKFLNFRTRCRIIELFFGSYGGQYSKPVMRQIDVAKLLGLRHDTVTYHIKRYVTNKGFLMAHPELMPRKRNHTKVTPEIVDYITDPKVLRSWSHLNLQERCDQIMERFGVRLVYTSLITWYRKNGITWSTPQYKMLGAKKRPSLAREQAEWSWKTTDYIQRGFEIIWIDETSTNLWDQRGRIWQLKGEPIQVFKSSDRGVSTTVIAGLFKNQGHFRYRFARSTNKEEFLEFLEKQIDFFVRYPRSTVLVMDNHRAHHSKVVTAWLEKKKYIVHFLPPYSSELNPIERVWAMMKHEWAKVLASEAFETRMHHLSRPIKELREEYDEDEDGELKLTTRQKVSQRELRSELGDICDNFTPLRTQKLAKGCIKEMLKVMQKQLSPLEGLPE